VVVCAKGDSSEFVRDQLREAGLPAVHVTGGVAAWGALHVPLCVASERLEVWQVSRYGKGCLSYLVASGGEAVVVDPSRFAGAYEDLARQLGARIVCVLDTHVHADHLSGAAELARRSGARHVTPQQATATGAIGVGAERGAIRALHTPGHTPESTSLLLSSGHLLSGDTLFASGVGRPDLGGELESWGRMLHASLRDVIGPLLPETVVLPGHFASAREARGDGTVCATLGQLRASLPELSDPDVTGFVARLAAGVRPPPPEYERIADANRRQVDPGEAGDEWELGRNECAAARSRTAPRPPDGHEAEGAHA
jgi:glyoxylase-like metal-dependent hydrolase (beta-lactamase superfamily II)